MSTSLLSSFIHYNCSLDQRRRQEMCRRDATWLRSGVTSFERFHSSLRAMRLFAPLWLLSVLAFCLLPTPFSTEQRNPATPTTMIIHVTVINPGTSSVRTNQAAVITSAEIVSVSDMSGFQPPRNARMIDAGGQYLIPGLWDMHV